MTDDPLGRYATREVASLVLHNARFVASSMSVIDRQDRVFADGVANVGDPVRLAEFDRTYTAVDGKLTLDPTFDLRSNRLDCIAVPVCGVGFFNYGHFLYDGLPMAVLYRQVAPHLRIRLVGQPLRPWQAQVLEALDLLIDYIPVSGPMVFSRLLANTLSARCRRT